MTNTKTKKQHYVPRFYLKGFCINGTEDQLFLYDKESMKFTKTNIMNVAHENFFYDITEEQIIEKTLSLFESRFNIALKKVIEKESLDELTNEDKDVLAKFIAVQYLRTKEVRVDLKQTAEAVLNLVGKSNIPNFKEGDVEVVESSLTGVHLKIIFESFNYFSELFKDKKWILNVNNSSTPYWTSDNPCAVHNDLEPEPFRSNLGIDSKGFQLYFPLSSKLLLVLIDKKMKVSDLSKARFVKDNEKRERYKKISKINDLPVADFLPSKQIVGEEQITFANNLQIISSTRFIFSSSNDFSLADLYLSEYPIHRDKNRGRFKVVGK